MRRAAEDVTCDALGLWLFDAMIVCAGLPGTMYTSTKYTVQLNRSVTALRALLLLLLATMATPSWADRQQDPALGRFLQKTLKEAPCFQDEFEQKVWYAAMEPKLKKLVKDDTERSEILHHVFCEARRLQLPPGLVMAVIDVESRFDRWAVSSAGAAGSTRWLTTRRTTASTPSARRCSRAAATSSWHSAA